MLPGCVFMYALDGDFGAATGLSTSKSRVSLKSMGDVVPWRDRDSGSLPTEI